MASRETTATEAKQKDKTAAERTVLASRKKRSPNINKKEHYAIYGQAEDLKSDDSDSENDDELQRQVSRQLKNELDQYLTKSAKRPKKRKKRRLRSTKDGMHSSSPSISTHSIDDDTTSDDQHASNTAAISVDPSLSGTIRGIRKRKAKNQITR